MNMGNRFIDAALHKDTLHKSKKMSSNICALQHKKLNQHLRHHAMPLMRLIRLQIYSIAPEAMCKNRDHARNILQ